MSKKMFLLITLLISYKIFVNQLTNNIITNNITLILQLLFVSYGFIKFYNDNNNYVNTFKNRSIFYVIFFIMIFSVFVPYIKYNQPVFDTLISQRFNYGVIYLLLFLAIKPDYKDFEFAFKITSIFSIILFVISIFNPLFFIDVENLNEPTFNSSTKIGLYVPGFHSIVIYFFFLLEKIYKKMSIKTLLLVSIYLCIILIYQNRSAIIGTLPIYLYTIVHSMYKHRKIKYLLFYIFILFSILTFTLNIFYFQFNKTNDELSNLDYERWRALFFFIFNNNFDIFNFLLGNGVWTSHGQYFSIMTKAAVENGIQISDIGLFGIFYYYGIIPIIIIYYHIFISFKIKLMPNSIRFYSIWILLVPTIHTFFILNTGSIIEFSFFIYIIVYFKKLYKINLINQKILKKQII